MRAVFLVLVPIFLFGQSLEVRDFVVDLHSKSGAGKTQKVSMDLLIESRDDEDYKIIDALNVVVGSFYAQDLLTSRGKEGLKNTLIQYTKKEYGIDIDAVYIQSLKFEKDIDIDELVKLLKSELAK